MNWYLIAFAILGVIMGFAPGLVADNVETCTETDLTQKERAKNGVKLWLYLFGLAIYLSLALLIFQVSFDLENEIKELESKIEVLEQQVPQVDTTAVNIQSL